MSSLNIVHVVRSPVGGIFRHICDLASAQSRAGHRVGVVLDSLTGGALEDERIAALLPDLALGAKRLPIPRSIGPADLPALLAVTTHVAPLRPDVIHAHGSKGGVLGRLAAAVERRKGRTVAALYAPHGGSLHYEPRSLSGRFYFTAERALERLTDGLIHVSAYEAEVYRRKVGTPGCPAHVVVNGLRSEEFELVQPEQDAADFIYIGMLRDLKGVDVLLTALALLRGKGVSPTALIVGAGDPADEGRYKEMTGALGLSDKVAFMAPMPARQAFPLARHIVVPSRAESMPYIVLEAAAAGLPMIATSVGGIPEILNGPNEQLLPPGNAEALADAMQLALAEPERMRVEALLRRERMQEKFSLSTMAARVDRIYRGALEGRYRTPHADAAARPGLYR